MRIYQLIENPYEKYQNPYVRTLIDGINSQFKDVIWGYGLSKFWDDEIFNYDIVHIHWPEIFVWHKDKHLIGGTDLYEKRLNLIKLKNIKIITTCHNLKPHFSDNLVKIQLYDITYRLSDCILHLGNYSLSLFKNKFPNIDNQLILHHAYNTIYFDLPSYQDSIKALGLLPNINYILCFGAFRNDEERNLIIELAKYLKGKNIAILAPSFCKKPKVKNLYYDFRPLINYYYYKLKYPNIITGEGYIDDDKLKFYYGASTISLIQRVEILNSGNVSLGFLMKNIVVGPNKGNVGTWLQETNNPTFSPSDMKTLFSAIDVALNDKDTGYKNYIYATKYLDTFKISSQLYSIYKKISNDEQY